MARYNGQRDSEITDQLEDFIIELLGDACGLMPKDEIKKQAKDLKKRAFDHIEDQIHGLEKEYEEKKSIALQGKYGSNFKYSVINQEDVPEDIYNKIYVDRSNQIDVAKKSLLDFISSLLNCQLGVLKPFHNIL